MTKTLEEYRTEAAKQTEPLRKRDITTIDNSANAAIDLVKNTYNKSVSDTEVKYESDYERNAVQKLINEKQIAEKNANLGLTDSGLNRTQQTAVQLSYANQKGDIDIAKQSALDKLNSDLTSAITDINAQREADKLSVNKFYDQQNDTVATSLYNTDVENEYKMWEKEQDIAYNQWKANLDARTALKKAEIQTEINSAKNIDTSLKSPLTNGSNLDYVLDEIETDEDTEPITTGNFKYGLGIPVIWDRDGAINFLRSEYNMPGEYTKTILTEDEWNNLKKNKPTAAEVKDYESYAIYLQDITEYLAEMYSR